MYTPNMSTELFEAIHNTFKDEPDVEADIYLYLKSLVYDHDRAVELNQLARMALDGMNRCTRCGSPLEFYSYEEPHTEISPFCCETLTDVYCPNCDGRF